MLFTDYNPSYLLKNKHVNTVYASLFRNTEISFTRERLETPDNDFFTFDSVLNNHDCAVLLLHGLEGSSGSEYIKGMARLLAKDFDVFAMNQRGCGNAPNKHFASYHCGKTDDLQQVVEMVSQKYNHLFVVGFSMGGNMILKLAGENPELSNKVKGIIGVSVPCDLESSAYFLKSGMAKIYHTKLMYSLKTKLKKRLNFEEASLLEINEEKVNSCATFKEFDDLYTAPANGFKDAIDYWTQSSCIHYLGKIKTPTIIVNALNDPFLPKECYPEQECQKNEFIQLFTPQFGGHVGFLNSFKQNQTTWLESNVLSQLLAWKSTNK